jgi:chromosome segregation ATPase
LQAANEQGRKRLGQMETQRTTLEQQKNDLAKQLEDHSGEREELRKQVSQRTTERDAAQTHLMQFSKELQALAGRIESAVNTSPPNPNVAIVPASRRKE